MSESKELYEKMNDEIRAKKPKMAICYDFDKTLSPDDMQTFTLIPSFGIDKSEFWQSSNKLAKDNLMDTNLAWMHELIRYSEFKRKSLKREYFRETGADVKLYKGVKTWFKRMNEYAEKKGIELEHYIISSGLKEIIEGSEIAQYFKRIYASTYLYSADGVAKWPAQAINYTNKTQFIFRIAKGFLEEYDERVNDSMPDELLRIPYPPEGMDDAVQTVMTQCELWTDNNDMEDRVVAYAQAMASVTKAPGVYTFDGREQMSMVAESPSNYGNNQ